MRQPKLIEQLSTRQLVQAVAGVRNWLFVDGDGDWVVDKDVSGADFVEYVTNLLDRYGLVPTREEPIDLLREFVAAVDVAPGAIGLGLARVYKKAKDLLAECDNQRDATHPIVSGPAPHEQVKKAAEQAAAQQQLYELGRIIHKQEALGLEELTQQESVVWHRELARLVR
jgi:hypothetical protein